MTVKKLFGTDPDQVSLNRDLGNLAFMNELSELQLRCTNFPAGNDNGAASCAMQFNAWGDVVNYGSNGVSWSSGYRHLKTNIKTADKDLMFSVYIRGFDYGSSRTIMSSFAGYAYPGNNAVINANIWNPIGSGLSINNHYVAADGYWVLVLYIPSCYVTTYVADFYSTDNSFKMEVTNAKTTATNSGAY